MMVQDNVPRKVASGSQLLRCFDQGFFGLCIMVKIGQRFFANGKCSSESVAHDTPVIDFSILSTVACVTMHVFDVF